MDTKDVCLLMAAAVLSVVATIFACFFILPEQEKSSLKPFGLFLHNWFNFKYLIVEKILRFTYVLSTAACLIGGLVMLFWVKETRTITYEYAGSLCNEVEHISREWMGKYGLLLMFVGTFAVRIAYELIMLAILAVKNIIEINHKLKDQNNNEALTASAPTSDDQTVEEI